MQEENMKQVLSSINNLENSLYFFVHIPRCYRNNTFQLKLKGNQSILNKSKAKVIVQEVLNGLKSTKYRAHRPHCLVALCKHIIIHKKFTVIFAN